MADDPILLTVLLKHQRNKNLAETDARLAETGVRPVLERLRAEAGG